MKIEALKFIDARTIVADVRKMHSQSNDDFSVTGVELMRRLREAGIEYVLKTNGQMVYMVELEDFNFYKAIKEGGDYLRRFCEDFLFDFDVY